MQRYTWEDALIEAQATDVISNGSLMLGLKLAHAIKWDADFSELRWANELAAAVVGVSRTSFYKYIKELKDLGYVITVKGNLAPVLPESHDGVHDLFVEQRAEKIEAYNNRQTPESGTSSISTSDSAVVESPECGTASPELGIASPGNRTSKSHLHNPYSVDTYTVNSSSEDSSSEPTASAAGPASLRSLAVKNHSIIQIEEDDSILDEEYFAEPSLDGEEVRLESPELGTETKYDESQWEYDEDGLVILEW